MPKSVTKIFSERHTVSIWAQQLRVAAYCRVSTKHEEQRRSLEMQTAYYSNYIRNNPNWELVDVTLILHPVFTPITALIINGS